MSILSQLKPKRGAVRKPKRVGRGPSSGHGKTSTRGHKGQKARSGGSVHPSFEGGQMPMYRRLPKRGFKPPFRTEYETVNIGMLSERFEANAEVTKDALLRTGVIKRKRLPLKVLGDGEIDKPLVVVADKFSKSAKEKIEAAGGKAIVADEVKAEEAKA